MNGGCDIEIDHLAFALPLGFGEQAKFSSTCIENHQIDVFACDSADELFTIMIVCQVTDYTRDKRVRIFFGDEDFCFLEFLRVSPANPYTTRVWSQ